MPTSRTSFKSPLILTTLLIFLIFLYSCQKFYDTPPVVVSPQNTIMVNHDSDILSDLNISLRQSSTSSPPAITVKVTNNSTKPVTILRWQSPLDPLALQLGLLSITPAGAPEPLDIPTIKVSRKLPPGEESLVSLAPGESRENEVVLKEMLVPLDKIKGKKSSVKVKGRWDHVWLAPRDQLTKQAVEELGTDGVAVSGEFETEATEIEVE